MKDCKWFLKGFCCKDLDAGRCWDCTCKDIKKRKKQDEYDCPYPRLGK